MSNETKSDSATGADGTGVGQPMPSGQNKGYNRVEEAAKASKEINDYRKNLSKTKESKEGIDMETLESDALGTDTEEQESTTSMANFLVHDHEKLVPTVQDQSGQDALCCPPCLRRRWSTIPNHRRVVVMFACAMCCGLVIVITTIIGTLAAQLQAARLASNPECLSPSGVVLDNLCRSAGYLPNGANGSGPVIGDVDFYTADAAWANATAQMQRLLVYAQLLIPQPVNSSLCSDDPDNCQSWTLFRVTVLGSGRRLFSRPSGAAEALYFSGSLVPDTAAAESTMWFMPDSRQQYGVVHESLSDVAHFTSGGVNLRPIGRDVDHIKSGQSVQQFWLQSAELILVGPSFAAWNMANPQRFVYNRLAIGRYNSRAYQTLSTLGAFRILDIGAPDDPEYLGNNRVISTWAFRFPGSTTGTDDLHSLYSDIEPFMIAGSTYLAVAVERLHPLRWTPPLLHHNLGVYIVDATNELNLHVIARIYENALWLDAHSITIYQPTVTSSLVFGRTMLAVVVRTETLDSYALPIADCRFYDVSVVSRPLSLGSWSYAQAWQYIGDPDGIGYQDMSADLPNYRFMAESIAISDDLVVIAYWNFGVQVLRITQYSTWTSLPTQFQLQQVAYYDDALILKPWSDPLAQPVFSATISVPLRSVYIADSWPACNGGVIKQLVLPATVPPSGGGVPRMQLHASVAGTGDTVSSLDVYTPGAPPDSSIWTDAQLRSTGLVVGRRRGGFQILNATSIVTGGQPAVIAAGSDHSGSEFEYIGVMNAMAFADAEEPSTTTFVAYSDRALGFGVASVRRWQVP